MANLWVPKAATAFLLSVICLSGFTRGASAAGSRSQEKNEENNVPSIRELVLQVTREVLEKTERRIVSLEQENKELRKENAGQTRRLELVEQDNIKLRATVTQLEQRFHYWDVINSYRNTPRTCEDVKAFGFKKSGEYLIDPDGAGIGEPAFMAQCDLSGPKAKTLINHDTMNLTSVNPCKEPGCHVSRITYQATKKQIKALINLSEDCSQQISYQCFATPLIRKDDKMAWWLGTDWSTNYYWDGQHNPSAHTCACEKKGNCLDARYSCNCDASAPQWLSDEGSITAKDALPIARLMFGGLRYDNQAARFQLSPLTCSGQKKHVWPPRSCEDLLKAGHTKSGYYVVDGEDGNNYRVVMCNLELDVSDSGFQVPTEVRFAEYPVAFDFSRSDSYSSTSTVVPYQSANVNLGNAMTLSGTFTAPLSGLYAFSFFFHEPDSDYTKAVVTIRARGTTVARIYKDYATADPRHDSGTDGTGGRSVLLLLKANETVDVFLEQGEIGPLSPHGTHFTGHLIYPLP